MSGVIAVPAANGADGFTPVAVVEEPVHAIPRDEARSGYRIYRARDGFEVAIPEHVIGRMIAWGRRAAPREWFALIVGRVHEDDRGRHVVVIGVVPDPEARAEHSFVETTPDSEFRTRTSARLLYPDGVVCGWVHGHVRHGAQYSSTDRKTQTSWTQQHSLGIVVDPWDPKEIAVYRGPDCEELARAAAAAETAAAAPPAPPPEQDDVMPRGGRLAVVVQGAISFVSALLAFAWIVGIFVLHMRLVRLEAREVKQAAAAVRLLRRIAENARHDTPATASDPRWSEGTPHEMLSCLPELSAEPPSETVLVRRTSPPSRPLRIRRTAPTVGSPAPVPVTDAAPAPAATVAPTAAVAAPPPTPAASPSEAVTHDAPP